MKWLSGRAQTGITAALIAIVVVAVTLLMLVYVTNQIIEVTPTPTESAAQEAFNQTKTIIYSSLKMAPIVILILSAGLVIGALVSWIRRTD